MGEKEVVAGLAVQTTDPASRRGPSYTKLRSHWNRRPWWLIRKKGMAASTIPILGALTKLRQVCCDPRLVRMGSAVTIRD